MRENLFDPFNGNIGYIAIKKTVNENTYHGWIKISTGQQNSVTIYEVAYNNTPNVPIRIGQKE